MPFSRPRRVGERKPRADVRDGRYGYPVSEDLILTSRHVVAPENRNRRAKIRVRWFYDSRPTVRLPAGFQSRKAIWSGLGKGDLDAALIRCRRPASLRRFSVGRLVERRPRDGERWESSGFARANKREDVREAGQFGGTLRSMAEGIRFSRLLEDAKPVAKADWSGVSGMPVFVGSEILGVVKHVPPNYDHKKLAAVPAWRLLQDEGFKRPWASKTKAGAPRACPPTASSPARTQRRGHPRPRCGAESQTGMWSDTRLPRAGS